MKCKPILIRRIVVRIAKHQPLTLVRYFNIQVECYRGRLVGGM